MQRMHRLAIRSDAWAIIPALQDKRAATVRAVTDAQVLAPA